MNRASEFRASFRRNVGRTPLENVPLRDHSNFRIGGPADYFFEARTADELRTAVLAARDSGVRCYIIGGGFNLLFDDDGYRGLILKNAVQGITPSSSAGGVRTAAGTSLAALVEFAAARGLEGFEYLAGIPGTVGGAVYGNAGAFGRCIGDFLEEAATMTTAGVESALRRDDFGFSYRHSKLKVNHAILLEAEFTLCPGRPDAIRAKIAEHLALRAEKHPPPETAYAGSYFKNPPPLPDGARRPAGWLLEQAGARDLHVGGAEVYSGHCNFLINARGASARDVLGLAAELKKRVRDRFGIDLEEEVIYLPADAPGL